MKRVVLFAAGALLWVMTGDARAQQGVIFGTVTDASKGILPGATVTVTNQKTGLTQTVVTNEQGDFRVRSLPLGTYSVLAELAGFNPITNKDIPVGLDAQVQVNLVMQVGTLLESVVVAGESPLVDVKRSEVGSNVTAEQIKILPVQGRQWIDLATLLPGTGQDAIRAQFYNSVNIGAGINFYSNGFYVDGVNNNWQQQGEPRQDFPQDAIAEFRVHAFNARSAYGFAQGGVLSTVTKSGTNEFHGQVFEYYRHEALNARTRFQEKKPDYHRHQVGGSLGGPVVQNKAQFFVSDEYTDEAQFFTVTTNGLHSGEEGTFERPYWNHMFIGRYDQTVSENHRAFARYAFQNNERQFIGSGGIVARGGGFTFSAPRHSIVGGETWVMSDKTVNDFRVQWAHATFIGWPSIPGLRWTESGSFPQQRVDSLLDIIRRPTLTTGNASSFIGPEGRLQIKNDLSHVVGSHELAFGADLNWVRWEPDNMGINRNFQFSTDAPFDPSNRATYPFNFSQRLSPTFDDIPSTEHSLYVDDSWRLIPDLTLSIGLRYDIQTGVWNEGLFEQELPEIRLVDRVIRPAGRPDPALFPFYDNSRRGDKNNLGPRLGFNWNIGGDGRQTLHGAYGIYYNRYRANGSPRAELNPLELQVIIPNPSYPDPYQGRDPFTVAAQNRNFTIQGNENRNPYTHQYSLGYTRQLGSSVALSIDGTIANGISQATQRDRNYFATPQDRAARVRPNPSFGQITEGLSGGVLRYRALEVRLERRFTGRWQVLGSYTLAYAKNSAEGFPADHFDPGADYGWAEADRRHRMVVSSIVQLVAGIQASAIARYQSSLPFNVTAGRDLNGDTITNDRPPGITRNTGCRDLDLSLVNSYREATGRSPVSEVQCGSYFTFDFQVSKRFNLGAQRSLEAILQVFNVGNRSNFVPPIGNALSPSFGQSAEVASPRQAELAVRFNF